MDLHKIIRELQQERKKVDQIIASLEQLQLAAPASSGVPPAENRRGRRSMDSKARQEVSERMKRYWANRRSQGANS